MTDLTADLEELGDALQQAVSRDRGGYAHRTTRRIAISAAAAALVLVAVGVSVAATHWPTPTSSGESAGLVAADAVFAGGHPQCAQVASAQFHCVLASSPSGLFVDGSYAGTKVGTVDADHHVNGGCVARSADGREWDCYIGQAAVDHGVVDRSYLGAYRPDVSHG